MTSSSPRFARLASILGLVWLGGCADFDRGDPPPPEPDVVGDAVVMTTFTDTIHDLLTDRCGQCHTAGAPRPFLLTGSADDDYDGAVALVDVDDPPSSALLRKTAGLDSHGGGRILAPTAEEYLIIEAWIIGGALK